MLDETKLKSVIAAILEIDENSVDQNTSMDNVESWDSIKHMDLILAIEEEFGVSVPDEEAADLTSYALIKLVVADLVKDKG
ncbi:acyl carrier protein [Methylobacterium sp. Leaf125]|jgi:acyl carrier protein|uniref:acyl carrier protein n=1 Tax=Methylobacterium sp. Leaf125 TaxID=1736265 RepID=UPI0006F284AD|nr:acyl carrier protein [Methylobacterium sp. Leaf125]KQQ41158.1 acyl carrier protein [Methylobacterium sp. Leaf125]